MSVRPDGTPAVDYSSSPAVSADGRFVAFDSADTGLVAGVTLPPYQLYVRDMVAGTTSLVSVSSAGVPGEEPSHAASISADGGRIAFTSLSDNLAPGDRNGEEDVFVHDTTTGVTQLVSHTHRGKAGRYASRDPSISANGTRITFASDAPDLVRHDTNGASDVFVYDSEAATTTAVSTTPRGKSAYGLSFAPEISADGTRVAFQSNAPDLVKGGDHNEDQDVFVADVDSALVTRVSSTPLGKPGNNGSYRPSISADGSRVAFLSYASNLDAQARFESNAVFLWDVSTGLSRVIQQTLSGSQLTGSSADPSISDDGTRVTYSSNSEDLVAGDTNGADDIFCWNSSTAVTVLVSFGLGGAPADGYSWTPNISGDGHFIAYGSQAANLVRGDSNGVNDVFSGGGR